MCIFDKPKNKKMTTKFITDTNEIKFKSFKSDLVNQIDVYYKNQRIAILNGLSAKLQWTAKNGSNIPNTIINKIEKIAKSL